ncbi:MAG: hypothetical protein ACM3UU_08920 [Ignavibacteriales bacterium]
MSKDNFLKYNELFSKLLLTLCFLLLIFSLILAHNSPTTGYEPSIYKSTHIVIWISLLFSIAVGTSIVIIQVYNQEFQRSYLWKIGLILVYLCNLFVISLFIIRGYYSWSLNGDAASHIGQVYHILTRGYLDAELFYPIMHVYATQLSLILGLDLIFLHKMIPLFFGILYVPFMYLFAKQVLPDKSHIVIATLVSCTFLNGWYLNFTPNTLSNLLFPLLLYIVIRSIQGGGLAEGIMVIIVAFLYPVFHPVPYIAFASIVAFISIPNKILIQLNKNKYDLTYSLLAKIKSALLLILFVWGIAWVSCFQLWQDTLINIHGVLIEGRPSQLNSLVSLINYAQGYGYSVTMQILKRLGGTLVYLVITLACAPIILKKMSKNPDDVKLRTLFSLYGPLAFFGVLISINYLVDLSFGPQRFIVYTVLISTLFVGFYLVTAMENFKEKKNSFIPLIIIAFLVGIFIHGILIVYPSPYILEMSQQTTKSEFNGMNWLLDNRNVDIRITGGTAAPYRFVDMLSPSEIERQKITRLIIPDEIKPSLNHFGYNSTNSLLSIYYKEDVYFPILDRDKSIYVDIFPEMAKTRWASDDFERINTDISVNKIYSNKGLIVYYINSRILPDEKST